MGGREGGKEGERQREREWEQQTRSKKKQSQSTTNKSVLTGKTSTEHHPTDLEAIKVVRSESHIKRRT